MKHAHSLTPEEKKNTEPFTAEGLVMQTFRLAKKLYNWTEKEMEQNYQFAYNACVETLANYKDNPIDVQRFYCAIVMLQRMNTDGVLNVKPNSQPNFTHRSWII